MNSSQPIMRCTYSSSISNGSRMRMEPWIQGVPRCRWRTSPSSETLTSGSSASAAVVALEEEDGAALAAPRVLRITSGTVKKSEQLMGSQRLAPGLDVARETAARVGRAGRWQLHGGQAQGLRAAGMLVALATVVQGQRQLGAMRAQRHEIIHLGRADGAVQAAFALAAGIHVPQAQAAGQQRSEEHTSELQSPCNLVCRLLLEKK